MNKDCKGSLTRELESQNPETKAEFEYDHAPDPQWKNFTCAVLKIWASGSSDNPGIIHKLSLSACLTPR